MWRLIITVLLSAALGSLAATTVWSFIDGTGVPERPQFIVGFSAGTLVFTVPGALMLLGLQTILLGQGLRNPRAAFLIALAGALLGGAILSLLSPSLATGVIGAFYGFATAVAFLCIQRLTHSPALTPN